MFDLLGPKTEADLAPASKNDKKIKAPKTDAKAKSEIKIVEEKPGSLVHPSFIA